MHSMNLFEGLEPGDLERLVHPEMHIDEFQSKMGDDQDIVVVSFKVTGKEPAGDLVSFAEKGYTWVLDTDRSSGEMSDGDYIVFIELERNKEVPQQIMSFMEDLMNLTNQKISDWRVRYFKNHTEKPLSLSALQQMIPLTPKDYEKQYGHEAIDEMKTAAGLPVKTKAPKNELTEQLRDLAGIKR